MDRELLLLPGMTTPALAPIRLDADSLANVLSVVADALHHRGEEDLASTVQLAQRLAEQVAEGLETLAHNQEGAQ